MQGHCVGPALVDVSNALLGHALQRRGHWRGDVGSPRPA